MTSATVNRNARANTVDALKIYWRIAGITLAAVAALGILLNAIGRGRFLPGFLEFDMTHNIVHVLLAVVSLAVGFGSVPRTVSRGLAQLIGVVYLALAVVGFIPGVVTGLNTLLHLHLEIGENLVHLGLGAYAAYVGFTD